MWQYGCSNIESVPGMLTGEYCVSVFNGAQADLDRLANRSGGGVKGNDYNRDGNSDLVGIRGSDGCLARWLGDGAGSLSYAGDTGCGWSAYNNLT